MPSATKNSVMKKSLTILTLVITSVEEGRLAMQAPAISAAMPDPTFMCGLTPVVRLKIGSMLWPKNTTVKHQASAAVRVSSGGLGNPLEAHLEDHLREHHRKHAEHDDADEGQQDRHQLGVFDVGLDQDHHDHPDVLEDQHAQGQAARFGIQLEVFLEQLDHQQGRRTGDHHAQVQRRVDAFGQQSAAEAQP